MLPEGYTISLDKSLLDFDVIFNYLSRESYWSKGAPEDVIRRSIEGSICFGVYFEGKQVGYARVVSDQATFAYLADVFILEKHRGKGLSSALMEYIIGFPPLQGLRRWMLATHEAHGLYAQFGFTPLAAPERFMELHNREVYVTM